jgi:hypothetical protein
MKLLTIEWDDTYSYHGRVLQYLERCVQAGHWSSGVSRDSNLTTA